MPRLAVAHVDIIGRTGKYKASIADVKRRTEGFGKSATKSLRRVTLGLAAMGAAATVAAVAIGVKLTRAMVRVGKATIVTAVRYDRLKIGLAAVAGGSKEAEIQLRRLEEVAKLPGLSFEGAIAGSTALQAAGLNAMLAERSLLAFGNALVTVGKGADDLKGVNLALTQIVTKGTGFGQELRQLAERLPQIRKAMKDAFGIGSVEDFAKLGLSAEQFIEGIVKEFEKLPKVSGTVANSLENLGIAFDRLKNEIGTTMLKATRDVSEGLTEIIDELRFVIKNFELFRDDIGATFKEIAIIGFKTWSAMLQSIVKLTIEFSRFIVTPLKATWKGIGLALEDSLGKSIIRAIAFTEEQEKKWMANREQRTKEHMATITAELDKDLSPAFEELAKTAEIELTSALNEVLSGIGDIGDRLKALTKEARALERFKSDWIAIGNAIWGILPALKTVKTDMDAATESVFSFVWAIGHLKFIKPGEFVDVAEFKNAMIVASGLGDRLASAFGNAGRTSDAFKDSIRDAMEEAKRKTEEFRQSFMNATSGMRNAFEDFVFQTLSDIDNVGDAWKEFIKAFKAAFLRMVANLLANAAVNLLFKNIEKMANLPQAGGGGGGAGSPSITQSLIKGIGTVGGALAGFAVGGPVGAGVGAKVGGDIGEAVGGAFVQNNTFNDMSFDNMDRNRLQKSAEQDFGPALAEAAVDGR